jgi:hypothetical protein
MFKGHSRKGMAWVHNGIFFWLSYLSGKNILFNFMKLCYEAHLWKPNVVLTSSRGQDEICWKIVWCILILNFPFFVFFFSGDFKDYVKCDLTFFFADLSMKRFMNYVLDLNRKKNEFKLNLNVKKKCLKKSFEFF